MKLQLSAIAVSAVLLSGAANAQLVEDTKTLTYELSGFVQSECTISPEGTQSRNIIMGSETAQGVVNVSFSCNSPYELTVESLNGGMDHAQSDLNIPYQVRTGGSIGGGSTTYVFFESTAITGGSNGLLDSTTDWLSIASNAGNRQVNVDVLFDDDTFNVAGDYSDELTVTLTPIL